MTDRINIGDICEISDDERVFLARVTEEHLTDPRYIIRPADDEDKREWYESEADELTLFWANELQHRPPFQVSLEVWRGGFRMSFTGWPEFDEENTDNTGLYEED